MTRLRIPLAFLVLSTQLAATDSFNHKAASVQASRPKIPAMDIDAYDKAGPYERRREPNGSVSKAQMESIENARQWLWSHWVQHRLGMLMETRYSIEGDRSTFFYFVEPDEQGQWRIGINVEHIYVDRIKNSGCRQFSIEQLTSHAVMRVETKRDEHGDDRLIPPNEVRSPSQFRIRMKLEEAENAVYY